MGRRALTVEEQIALLKKRGLKITNDKKAKEYLLDIGYYRLGFYWHYFQDAKTHQFQKGISLRDIVQLYYFDFDIKNLLSRYIHRIEVHFRTQVVYYVSNHYKTNEIWYTDAKIVNHYVLKDFNKIYYILRMNNEVLKKHHSNYPSDVYAPTWKTFEFLTFGQIYKIYYNLKDKGLKDRIANVYGIRDSVLLDNYFRSIINIRNLCSHNAVLYDYQQPIGIRRIPNKYYRNKTQNNTSLNTSLRLILFILSKISVNRANDLEQSLQQLFKEGKKNSLINNIISNQIIFDL